MKWTEGRSAEGWLNFGHVEWPPGAHAQGDVQWADGEVCLKPRKEVWARDISVCHGLQLEA